MGEVLSLGAAKISVLILLGNWVVCVYAGGWGVVGGQQDQGELDM